jgi:hypothetical protein
LQFVAGGLDDFQLEPQFGKRFAALRGDQVRLRERERAAAGDNYNGRSEAIISTQRHSEAKPQANLFGLRREAKRHAALETLSAVEKRCRRCALPPQSKIFAARKGSNG